MRQTDYIKYDLDFKFNAGTSRGVLKKKETHLIKIWDDANPTVCGLGELGMFRGLSADDNDDFEEKVQQALADWRIEGVLPIEKLRTNPSVLMGLEMAMLDLATHGNRNLFPSGFTEDKSPIPINGLIWMGDKSFMKEQIIEKIDKGFNCIKLKIGALDFDHECDILKYIRDEFSDDIILRVDANGAFRVDEALEKLKRLSSFRLHSIEQPIKAGQWEAMADLCEKTPLDIALDEELVGVFDKALKRRMLEVIKPQHIILKPSLVGGFTLSDEWIDLAASQDIGWWITSALESNIGLNAIAQWTATLPYSGHQGLGTGSLFHNNFSSPLEVTNGLLHYNSKASWSFEHLKDFYANL